MRKKKMLVTLAAVVATIAGPSAVTASAADTGADKEKTTVTRVPGSEGLYEIRGDDIHAAAYDACGGGTCFFRGLGGEGQMWVVPSCGRHNVPSWFRDAASSAWNRTNNIVLIFKDTNQGGYFGPMPRWFQGNLAGPHQGEMSSVDVLCM
ncbi:peptidase inhibitor family I36 protein [Streptomyces sp. NPDC059063]|uniref:peptidase inhibitor family I36 protein n=1 Tax=unclassified Streptomyces TaxID=2593676 RepID=UPI0036C340CB